MDPKADALGFAFAQATGGLVNRGVGAIFGRAFAGAADATGGSSGGSTTLFRAVLPAELESIESSGMRYTLGPNSYGTGTKGFFSSAEEAAAFSQKMFGRFPNEGPYTVTSTTVPNSFLRGYNWQYIAGEGNAIFTPPPPTSVKVFNFSPYVKF
jgi:hypothetical protein